MKSYLCSDVLCPRDEFGNVSVKVVVALTFGHGASAQWRAQFPRDVNGSAAAALGSVIPRS